MDDLESQRKSSERGSIPEPQSVSGRSDHAISDGGSNDGSLAANGSIRSIPENISNDDNYSQAGRGLERSNSLSGKSTEAKKLFQFSEAIRDGPNPDPWFMEMTRLRRLHFLHLNNRLAAFRKDILEKKEASNEDVTKLAALLHEQAEAIRDFQYIRSLDYLSEKEQDDREAQCVKYFPDIATSDHPNVYPFQTENYRRLFPEPDGVPVLDGVRDFLRIWMPVRWTWTKAEKEANPGNYADEFNPKILSPLVDRLAGFIVAFTGALFILVPMYIMTFGNRTRNLITTTVAVILFAALCSIPLRASNEQTLGATLSYAAVLMVFVGLTTQTNQ